MHKVSDLSNSAADSVSKMMKGDEDDDSTTDGNHPVHPAETGKPIVL
jgi:hypothetical protein